MKIKYMDMIATLGIGGAHPGGLTITKHIVENLNLSTTAQILDVGCGTGQTLAFLAETKSNALFGVDQHPVMIQQAKERLQGYPNVTLHQANIENLPFPKAYFDVILSESVTAFTSIQQALNEYARVLSDDGVLVLIEMTANHLLTKEAQAEIEQFYHISKLLTEDMWCTAIELAGFNRISVRTIPEELENIVDFELRPVLEPTHLELMATHYYLIDKYQDSLSARVYYCKK